MFVNHRRSCYQVLDANGTVYNNDEGCIQITIVAQFDHRDGQWHVGHNIGKDEYSFTVGGTTYQCAAFVNSTFVNGEFRHNVQETVCDPPLF
jgi:hypothetical protein